jgi:hypothetical protein
MAKYIVRALDFFYFHSGLRVKNVRLVASFIFRFHGRLGFGESEVET